MEKILHGIILTGAPRAALVEEAWRLAGKILCAHPTPGGESCGVCAHCRKVARRIHPDVAVLERLRDREGKTRREIVVEQIRALERDAVVLPNEGSDKVYLIPEAETLNAAAQNAFLKLLEEPPEFVSFLLCAENPGVLLPTIRSRCAVHRVAAAPAEESGGEGAAVEEYLAALGDEAALLRCCNRLERLTAAEFREFITALRLRAAETLRGAELLSLERELEHIAAALRVNVSVRHAVGWLCTYRYQPDEGGKVPNGTEE